MKKEHATVTQPCRLDQFAAHAFHLSRAQAQKYIKEGFVRCNGKVICKASKMVHAGDHVHLMRPSSSQHRPTQIHQYTSILKTTPIPILYEDVSCLVVNKPASIAVHPAPSHRDEPTLIEILREERGEPGLSLAHRLDRGTSGCLLVAKSVESCEALQQQFKERHVKKEYLAMVAGIPKERSATIDAPLGRSLMHRTKMTLFRTSKSREAATTYSVLSSRSDCSLLACVIATGRTHQIRVHLAAIGHPILGDEKYGTEQSRTLGEKLGLRHPCLHAWKLSFQSPAIRKEAHVMAPIPETFRRIAQELDLSLSSCTHKEAQ